MRSVRLTNRYIAGIGDFTLPQVRRWAVLVLGRDPEAEKGKGVKRLYDLDEAFKIYLAGFLIRDFNMSLEDTKTYLNYIWPALRREKLLPSQLLEENDVVNNFKEDFYDIEDYPRCTLVLQPHGICHLKITLKFEKMETNIYKTTCKYIPIYPEDFNDIFSVSTEGLPQWNVFLDDYILYFIKSVFNLPGANLGTNLWEFLIKSKDSRKLIPE